ncbi:PREDICTED: trypsin-5-like [Ceratosolen solmsi marchali]|uniref:Trypsin-5-like n=1 Tax=Ceratosolen solmsi marchali TaxID=326594 RepID=A0AAJ6YSC0_9HYME|nr:PREDICTED: trypsin-5-like [Ceratosolen solmsi marchali]
MSIETVIFVCVALSTTVFGKDTRIGGGDDTNNHQFSYHASLKSIYSNDYLCGGAIISKKHILTTAYCVNIGNIIYSDLMIQVGTTKKSNTDGLIVFPDRIFSHPMYTGRPSSTTNKLYNIAIIRIKETLPFNNYQNKVMLPSMDVINNFVGTLSGWSTDLNMANVPMDRLKMAIMIIIDMNICKSSASFAIYSDQFCTYHERITLTNSDNGSPLVSDNRLIGLADTSQQILGHEQLFVNVFSHIEYIRYIVGK